METEKRLPLLKLSQTDLRHFFISHLNRIYCAKSQLAGKLPELSKRAAFLNLRQAIDETVELVENQIRRMREIYIALDAVYTPESCIGLVGLLDEAFQSIGDPRDSAAIRDLSVLFYMQNIESIETAAFKTMMLVAGQFAAEDIAQLLRECYDEAQEDKTLFLEITKNYLQE